MTIPEDLTKDQRRIWVAGMVRFCVELIEHFDSTDRQTLSVEVGNLLMEKHGPEFDEVEQTFRAEGLL